MREDFRTHPALWLDGRWRWVITTKDISCYVGGQEQMDDPRKCAVCGRIDLHTHDDHDIAEWEGELNRSIARHPAGRRLNRRNGPPIH